MIIRLKDLNHLRRVETKARDELENVKLEVWLVNFTLQFGCYNT